MAVVNNFVATDNTERTYSASTAWTATNTTDGTGKIAGSNLAANTKYLIVARAAFNGDSASRLFGFRVDCADDSNIATRSEMQYEPGYGSTAAYKQAWGFVGTFTTDSSPGDVQLQYQTPTNGYDVRCDQTVLWLLDLDDLGSDNYEISEAHTTSSEYPTTAASLLSIDASANLTASSTYLILGYCLTDFTSTSESFKLYLTTDRTGGDTGTSQAEYQWEGENSGQQIASMFAGVHKTSATPTYDPAIFAEEESASVDAVSESRFLIAIDTGAFDDFGEDFTAASTNFSLTKTTVETLSSYQPDTTADHLVIGAGSVSSDANAVEVTVDGTTILSGDDGCGIIDYADSTDRVSAVIFNRVEISSASAIDVALKAVSLTSATENIKERGVYVLSLEKATAATNECTAALVATAATTGDAIQIHDPSATIAGSASLTDDVTQLQHLQATVAAQGETSDGVVQTNQLSIVPP